MPNISQSFAFITPNLKHNGASASADNWLKQVVGQIMQSSNYTDGSTLIELTWDEGSGTNQIVNTALVNPALSHVTLTGNYNHYSLPRLNEELLGYPLLGAASTANDMRPELGL